MYAKSMGGPCGKNALKSPRRQRLQPKSQKNKSQGYCSLLCGGDCQKILVGASIARPCPFVCEKAFPENALLRRVGGRPMVAPTHSTGQGCDFLTRKTPAALCGRGRGHAAQKSSCGLVMIRNRPRCRSSSTSAAFPSLPDSAGAGWSRCRRLRWRSWQSRAVSQGRHSPG